MWTGPILESKGMLAVFQKKDNKKKKKRKRTRKGKVFENLAKIVQNFKIF